MSVIRNFERVCFQNCIVKDHFSSQGTAEFRKKVTFNTEVCLNKGATISNDVTIKGNLCIDGNITQVTNTFDYIIVGGGTAGCVLARKLSDDFNNSVLVIEGGANVSDDPAVLASNIFAASSLASDPTYSEVYQAQFTAGQYVVYSDGRGLGGGSMHNGLEAVRGTKTLWDQWASLTGEASWSYNNLLTNVMKPMETYTPNGTVLNPAQRGTSGPLNITQEPPVNTDPLMIAIGTVTGSPQVSDYNDPSVSEIGIGSNQNWVTPPFNGVTSVRSFSANAFLTGVPIASIPAVINPNGTSVNPARKLTVLTNSHCNRVLFDSFKNATGVEFVSTESRQMITVHANKYVILCAGSIADAAILQRSGVGDSALLSSLNIPEVFANSNVGTNMQNHYGAVAVLTPGSYTVPFPQVGAGFIDLSGYGYTAGKRRIQLVVAPFPFTPVGINQALGIPGNATSILGLNDTPNEGPAAATSYGSVTIASTDLFVEPEVLLNFYSDGTTAQLGSDAHKIVSFYKTVQDIANVSGDTVLFPTPANYADGDAALLAAASSSAFIGGFHNSGTCRMAPTAATGVCDGKLRVFGVNKLLIADNAAAPLIEDGNTGYQAYVIGHQAALFIASNFA